MENTEQHLDNDNLILSSLESHNVNKMNSLLAAKCNGVFVPVPFLISVSQGYFVSMFQEAHKLYIFIQSTDLTHHVIKYVSQTLVLKCITQENHQLSATSKSSSEVL